jgi:hypothetical protein
MAGSAGSIASIASALDAISAAISATNSRMPGPRQPALVVVVGASMAAALGARPLL